MSLYSHKWIWRSVKLKPVFGCLLRLVEVLRKGKNINVLKEKKYKVNLISKSRDSVDPIVFWCDNSDDNMSSLYAQTTWLLFNKHNMLIFFVLLLFYNEWRKDLWNDTIHYFEIYIIRYVITQLSIFPSYSFHIDSKQHGLTNAPWFLSSRFLDSDYF